jgi:hypothetical protein
MNDVGMVQAGDRSSFTLEAITEGRIAAQMGGENLDRYGTRQ